MTIAKMCRKKSRIGWLVWYRLVKIPLIITLILVGFSSYQMLVVAQSQNQPRESELPKPPDTGTPEDDSIPGGTRTPEEPKGYWDEQIWELEKTWEGIYENYFDEDFPSLSLSPRQISEKLAQLSEQTGKKTAVVWMTPREDGLFLFIITPNHQSIGTRVLEADHASLSRVTQGFWEQISNPESKSYLKAAQQLYQWMIAPIEYHLLTEKIDTLILCVGPGLRSLPFAALHDGQRFLIEKYGLTRIPGFNLTQWDVADLNQAQVLAMGASEFNEAKPLPGVAMEISEILPTPWKGIAILNQDFTVANLKKMRQQKPFQLIHLATHAQFNPGSPNDSYIQFADAQLSLNQLGELSWRNPPVELLVLSACTTALGDIKAELGFVGLAVHSGVKSALGSLWHASDVGTLALMSEFYWQLKVKPLKAEALRQAQIAMISGEISLQGELLRTPREPISLTPKMANLEQMDLSHPYYWANFSLIGNPF